MDGTQDEVQLAVCPFIDMNDARCATRFSLSRMDEAFDLCLARHLSCVTYYQKLRELRGETAQHATPTTRLTIQGRPAAYVARGRDAVRATAS